MALQPARPRAGGRDLSFLEPGRSQPRELLVLRAARYAPIHRECELDDPDFAAIRAAAQRIPCRARALSRHDGGPAMEPRRHVRRRGPDRPIKGSGVLVVEDGKIRAVIGFLDQVPA